VSADLKDIPPPWGPEEVMDDEPDDHEIDHMITYDTLRAHKIWLVCVTFGLVGMGVWLVVLSV